ncbi:hypothetical protein [Enterobacter asburiae]
MLDKRTERLRADVDKQIKAANERADKAEAFSNKFRDRVLGDAIRAAASKAGALTRALRLLHTSSQYSRKHYQRGDLLSGMPRENLF